SKRLLFVRRRHEHELQTRLTKSRLSPARSFKNVGIVKLFGANLLAAENTVEARRVNVLVLQDSTLRLILPPLSEIVSRLFWSICESLASLDRPPMVNPYANICKNSD